METEATKEKQLIEGLKISGQVDQLLSKDGEPASVIDFKIKLWNSFRDKIKMAHPFSLPFTRGYTSQAPGPILDILVSISQN